MRICTEEFLNLLYEPLLKDAGEFALSRLYVGAIGSHERVLQDGKAIQIWRNMADFSHFISDINEFAEQLPHNINYTVTPRSRPESKKPYVAGSTCFWADIDNFLYYRWKQIKYPKLINTWLEPNILVNSGWGVHLYWLFDDFVPFGEGSGFAITAEKFNFYMRIISWYLGADMATAEHLLRMPGTYNCKSSPDKLTEINIVNSRRRNFSELTADLETGMNGVLKSERTPKHVKETIEAIFRSCAPGPRTGASGPSAGQYDNSKADIKDVDTAVESIRKISSSCRLLETAFYAPEELSYRAWFSIGAALGKTVKDPFLAREIFYKISLPGNRTNNPQGEIYGKFENIRNSGHMPYGSSKIPECAGCRLFIEGKCRNLITAVRRVIAT